MDTNSTPTQLKGSERMYLRGLAHHLKPTVQVGKTGVSPNVLAALDEALEHHELIKVRFVDFKEQRKTLAQSMAQESGSALVGLVGNVAILYRQQSDPKKRKIKLAS